jgi:hypothetical protein
MTKTWWHVIQDRKVFGFASVDGIVRDVPYGYYHWLNKKLEEIRCYFKQQDIVIKIGEIKL